MSDVIIVACITCIPGSIAAYVSWINSRNIKSATKIAETTQEITKEVKIMVDGRLSLLIDLLVISTKDAGFQAGLKAAKELQDAKDSGAGKISTKSSE
jgi:hypothetical protein